MFPDLPRLTAAAVLALHALPCVSAPPTASSAEPFRIPVLVLQYFPTNGELIDIQVTGDWGESLAATRKKTRTLTDVVIEALEIGSRYKGYVDHSAVASLDYEVVDQLEFLRPLPVKPKQAS
jgi:hypothetical protein